MLHRSRYLRQLARATARAPVTALLGTRQCGKTTLARAFAETTESTCFDLESDADLRRLTNPEMVLGALDGLVVLDEIQRSPNLFNVLRVLVDRPTTGARFLILGSASPDLVRGVSESLAGRVRVRRDGGLQPGRDQRAGLAPAMATGCACLVRIWPLPTMTAWLGGTGSSVPSWSGTSLNSASPSRRPPCADSGPCWRIGTGRPGMPPSWAARCRPTDKTVRRYLDLLTGTYMVRQLQPWFENLAKRQVKAPKVYLRDTGILHALLGAGTEAALLVPPSGGRVLGGFRDRAGSRIATSGERLVLGCPRRRRGRPPANRERSSPRLRDEVQRKRRIRPEACTTWSRPCVSITSCVVGSHQCFLPGPREDQRAVHP